MISPKYYNNPQGNYFMQEFMEVYGYSPDMAAAYAFDGMNLILEAIGKGGFNREKIRDSLSQINYKDGVTGEIHFDDIQQIGERIVPLRLTVLPLEKPDERTVLHYRELVYDLDLDESYFSLRNL